MSVFSCFRLAAGLACCALLLACGGKSESSNSSGPITMAPAEGRLLASNCFQCHGTGGVGGFESIRGSEASEVLEYLTAPNPRADIMAAHAQGYTRAQLESVIRYLQQ